MGAKMFINYSLNLLDEHGNIVFPDVECVVGTTVTFDPDEPTVFVDSVNIIGYGTKPNENPEIELGHSSITIWQMLEGHIARILAADTDFYDKALEEAGITYHSRGANDPDGHYVQKAE